jgi:hypothetical protein
MNTFLYGLRAKKRRYIYIYEYVMMKMGMIKLCKERNVQE